MVSNHMRDLVPEDRSQTILIFAERQDAGEDEDFPTIANRLERSYFFTG